MNNCAPQIEFELTCVDFDESLCKTIPRELPNILTQLEENCFLVKKRYHCARAIKEREYQNLLVEYNNVKELYEKRLAEYKIVLQSYKLQFANILDTRKRYKELFAQIYNYSPELCVKAYDCVREIFDNSTPNNEINFEEIDPLIVDLVSDIIEGKYGYFDTEIFDIWREYCTHNPNLGFVLVDDGPRDDERDYFAGCYDKQWNGDQNNVLYDGNVCRTDDIPIDIIVDN